MSNHTASWTNVYWATAESAPGLASVTEVEHRQLHQGNVLK